MAAYPPGPTSAITHALVGPCLAAGLSLGPEEHWLVGALRPGGLCPGGSLCSRGPCFLHVQTERVPLDVSPRLEEALDFSELEAEPSEGGDFEARGSRFSKSADERQRMLVQRKDDLLQQARK